MTFDWVTVGDPGNTPDPITGHGIVTSEYRISKHELTNAHYAEFNAKAASDPLALYNTGMATRGGITRSGSSGNYTYAVIPGRANNPVGLVSWYDSVRFVNWLHNGQGAGDTEAGAYTLQGGTPTPSNGNSVTRNVGATVFLPSLDEWYKAAYHQPASAGGDADDYWLYPTATNAEPNSDQPPGDPLIEHNVANFFRDDQLANGYNDGYAVTGSTRLEVSTQTYTTDVGAYSGSDSHYGTFDQGGNVFEWNETLIPSLSSFDRGVRGGSWMFYIDGLRSDQNGRLVPFYEYEDLGFRVAIVPEPALGVSLLMLITLAAPRRSLSRRTARRAGHIKVGYSKRSGDASKSD